MSASKTHNERTCGSAPSEAYLLRQKWIQPGASSWLPCRTTLGLDRSPGAQYARWIERLLQRVQQLCRVADAPHVCDLLERAITAEQDDVPHGRRAAAKALDR